ncbi:DUF262 domain-containing protein [Halopiger aswanensis]|uniref:Uncharacterized protein with ParB-like and HNH nuclease domain n=1 Tax=Halopiger aswanensis TaxID=148449 RepID=A0A3R7DZZ1_9EURY|nr:DUF262 domain-containing protein [Halopiger aswanensis]RKD95656.1 uncharacterized protein with ParB-like and HNH nuclease domain [Halopiger aswanensis]
MEGALGISANEDSIESALRRGYRYRVPDYQRRYSWKKQQWRELWNDLRALEDEQTHFLGAVVVVERPGNLNQLDTLEVVDGQQRLATVSLLLVAMRDRYRKEGEISQARAINNDYLWVSDLDQNKHQNLTLNTFDNEIYNTLLTTEADRAQDSQLKSALQYFHNRVDQTSLDELDTLRKRLLRSFTLVSIECNSDHSAFRLFETLNNRGLELTADDLIKNHLFNVASSNREVEYERIKKQWLRIIENIIPTDVKPALFFRHYLMSSPLLDIQESITEYTLYDRARKIIDKEIPQRELSLENLIRDMADAAELYASILLADIQKFDDTSNSSVNRKLKDIHAIGMGASGTLLLRLFQEIDNPNKAFEILQLLEAFLLRQKIVGYPSGAASDRLYARLCSNAFDQNNPVKRIKQRFLEEVPSDTEFRAGIVEKRATLNSRTRYMLRRIESDHYHGIDVGNGADAELEHIAPRAAFSAKKYSTWPGHLGVDEEVFEQYKDRLGNITLLESRHNAASGKHPFQQKKREYASSKYSMSQEIADQHQEWSTEKIQSRTEYLADVATQIWKIEPVNNHR